MKLSDNDRDWARKQTKSRQRPRSTTFDDGVDKAERRQQRRLSEKKLIDEEFDLELEENEEVDHTWIDGVELELLLENEDY